MIPMTSFRLIAKATEIVTKGLLKDKIENHEISRENNAIHFLKRYFQGMCRIFMTLKIMRILFHTFWTKIREIKGFTIELISRNIL